ncbi:MAG: LysE family translocator [Azospirillaceae bacterium]
MDPVLVLIGVFAIFLPALVLPGPDFVAVVRSSMAHGVRSGLLTTVGVSCGLCLYASLSLVGLSAILVEYQWVAVTVRVAGGCYLIYLGFRLLRARPGAIEAGDARPPSGPRALAFGFLVNLTNPKAIVLFASVFATAVGPATPLWLMGTMIALVTASAFVWYAGVSVFMASPAVLRRFGALRHRIERAAGVCFIAFGGKVLTSARDPVAP